MRVKGNLQASVPATDLPQRLPPRFKNCVDASLIKGATVDLLLFTPGDRNVVSSKDLAKALQQRNIQSESQLVAVGYDFTQEARDLISNTGGLLFVEGGYFGWTDEMWRSIRQGSAT